MTGDTLFVFGLLLVTVALFVSDKVRLDIVALLVILALMLSGVLTPAEAVAGFGDPVVLLIAGLFVVGEGLFRTGLAYAVGNWLMGVAGEGETRLLVLLMLVVAALSAVMSSTGAVAIFIPVVMSLAAKTGTSPSRLLMPMAFASLIGGMLTLIGTPPNLVVSTELSRQGLAPFNFFSFTPIGLVVLVVGVLYVVFAGRRLLAARGAVPGPRRERRTLQDLIRTYDLTGRIHRIRLPEDTVLAGRSIAHAAFRKRFGVNVLAIERRERFGADIRPALIHSELQGGDVLYVAAREADLAAAAGAEGLRELPIEERQRQMVAREMGLAEVLLTPRSGLIGQTLGDTRFRERYDLSVVAVLRAGQPVKDDLRTLRLEFGDTLLVAGGWEFIDLLQAEKHDFLLLSLPEEINEVAPRRARAPLALLVLAVMLVLMTFNIVPATAAVLLAALGMVVTGCVTMRDAYASINWQSLVLIAGMLPMATALEQTGGMQLMIEGLVAGLGGYGPYALMAGLFVLTSVFSQFISNTATTVLVAPIAVGAAATLGVSPYTFLMTVAIAASTAFSTPVASPVNTLVLGPGGYRFNDFLKVGVPLQVLCMVIALLVVPLIFPLG